MEGIREERDIILAAQDGPVYITKMHNTRTRSIENRRGGLGRMGFEGAGAVRKIV
jgi:hypothetical protein